MSYSLIDSGHGRKLENLGGILVNRQAPTAIWAPTLSPQQWQEAKGVHQRSDKGGGHWDWITPVKPTWQVELGVNRFWVKPTPFGHLGLFAEQEEQWSWIKDTTEQFVARENRAPEVLNLFAYTGGSTLAAARAGARVTHVDAAKGVVDWAKQNAQLNDLDANAVRWIVDDCSGFVAREARRGKKYDGIILDPPTFGRGKKNEVWTIEDSLGPLLENLGKILTSLPFLFLLSCHSPGYTPIALRQLASDYFEFDDLETEGGEMSVPHHQSKKLLPSGFFTRSRPVR